MRLIIIRHGETEENKVGIIQGHLPGHLSEVGIEQAKKVAQKLKNEKIDFIIPVIWHGHLIQQKKLLSSTQKFLLNL